MTRATYPRSRISTRHANTPYRSTVEMIAGIDDGPGQAWYHDAAHDLHLRDFIFHTRMQTARRVQERTQRFPDRDMVLERLIAEGTFDRVDPNTPDVREELAMNHSSAMVQQLLMRVENLESQVSLFDQLRDALHSTDGVCQLRNVRVSFDELRADVRA